MPYRRLPNTDQARIRTLKAAVAKGESCDIRELPFSINTLALARAFLNKFEIAHNYYTRCYENQTQGSSKHQANVKMARLYLSHFIQVLNMCIARGEIKSDMKKHYGLPANMQSLPDLTAEVSIVEWGKKIIDGERKRSSLGGIPLYNPTIAKVKVHYDVFKDSFDKQKGFQSLTNKSLAELAAMRKKADELILEIWNGVEAKFQDVASDETRLQICREFGIIYYYRANEKQPQLF